MDHKKLKTPWSNAANHKRRARAAVMRSTVCECTTCANSEVCSMFHAQKFHAH